ncbi:hypothetical protein Tco_1525243 [Tanacetum coccineum]
MIETILHEREIQQLLNEKKLQTQEVQSNTIQALNVDLVIIGNNGLGKKIVDTGKALDVGLVVTESSGTESEVQDESNGSWNDTYADDADIRPVYDEEPMDEELKLPVKEVKVKHDIDVTETINIKLEHNVAKLLTENEHLNMEKEHSKKTYKDLYDSIKKTRVQTKDHNDSLTEQLNKKSIENADSKAQIQEKVFAIAALKNKLRKLKGNSVDTKFAKPSILEKRLYNYSETNQLLENRMRLNLNDLNFHNHGLPPKLM